MLKDIFHESVEPEDMKRKLQDAASVITVSDYNLKYLQQMYGAAAAPIQRIYNGLNLNQLGYKSPQERPPTILSVSRLVEKKGVSVLIDACSILAHRGCSFHCQIIGSGSLAANLREQIQHLGLESTVEIIGSRPQNEVFEHIQNAAVFAAPYIIGSDGNREGLPTVLLETMALGTPCVATDVTGIPEVVRHEETGLMVAQHDSQALANALERLLINSSLRVKLATKARQLIESEFDIYRNTAVLRTIFNQVVNQDKLQSSPVVSNHILSQSDPQDNVSFTQNV